MTYRRFSDAQEQIAAEWASHLEATDQRTLGANAGRGEAGSFHITSDKGYRAVCKPAFIPSASLVVSLHARTSILAEMLQPPSIVRKARPQPVYIAKSSNGIL